MKKFTKLALVSSIALSANAMAMQAMDDSALSATTGQDGITIGIGISKITIDKLFIHDTDGYASVGTAPVAAVPGVGGAPGTPAVAASAGWGGTSTPGAIVIKGDGKTGSITKDHGLVITAPLNAAGTAVDESRVFASHNLVDLRIDSDAGTSANGGAFLNIAADVAGLDIYVGEIGVTASNAEPDATADSIRRGGKLEGADKNYNAILSGLTLKTGKMNANIQVGAAPQGAMIKLDTTMIGGLEIKNLGLLDSSTKQGSGDGTANNRAAGEIFIESIKIADANSRDLTLNQDISVYATGAASANGFVQITSKNTTGQDIYVKGIHLGSRAAASIGDVEVQGLQTYYGSTMSSKGAIITISGH